MELFSAARRKQDLLSLASPSSLRSPPSQVRPPAAWPQPLGAATAGAASAGRLGMLVGPGQPAPSALRRPPRLYLSRARPPLTGPGGHLAGTADSAEGRRRRAGRVLRGRAWCV